MSRPRVFVVQNQHRWDEVGKELVPKFNLLPAEEYGELVYLLGPSAAPWQPRPAVLEMREELESFTDEDYLLLIGNPVLIGMAFALAAHYNGGCVKVLQWSGKDRRYIAVDVQDVFPDEELQKATV